MATPCGNVVKPDHIIIWCDKNMGKEENNIVSKSVLNVNADLNLSESIEYDSAKGTFIGNINPYLNESKFSALVKSPLRIFTNENECMKAIYDNIEANKRVFVITSGQTGALIIPEIFKEPEIRRKLSRSVYIFCAQRDLHEQWTKPYENDIEIYDDERGVFGKVLADIGAHYFAKAEDETTGPTAVMQYLYWAGRLFNSATKVDSINRDDYLKYIQATLPNTDERPTDGYDSDVQIGVSAEDHYMDS